MQKRLFLMRVAVVLCVITGCTRGNSGIFSSGQETMESAGQWNVLANHVADRINRELMRQQYLQASVYVRPGCSGSSTCDGAGASQFDTGFNDLLTTQLVSFGVPTVASPEQARLIVEYKVQALYHPPEYRKWRWPKPGVLTALAAGIVVFENAPWEIIAGATAVDIWRNNYQPDGQHEVIITTSILDNKRYVMRTSDIYSIPNSDYWQYQHTTSAAEIRLTGSSGPHHSPGAAKKTSL